MEIYCSMLILIGYNKHNVREKSIINILIIAFMNCKLCFVVHNIARHINNYILSYGLREINGMNTTVNYNLYNIIL